MVLGDRGSVWRCLMVWAFGTSSLATVVLLVLPRAAGLWTARSQLEVVPLDLALVDASACVVVACAAWAWLAVTAAVTEAWRGAEASRRRPWHLPPGVRRVVLAACGVALASTSATIPAHAVSGIDHRQAHGVGLLSGLPLPDRAVAPRAPSRSSAPPGSATRTVTVHRGDTLWSIAARDLPAGAPDQAIASRWRAIYDANRGLVGSDPDVIEPGQHLHLPRKDQP